MQQSSQDRVNRVHSDVVNGSDDALYRSTSWIVAGCVVALAIFAGSFMVADESARWMLRAIGAAWAVDVVAGAFLHGWKRQIVSTGALVVAGVITVAMVLR